MKGVNKIRFAVVGGGHIGKRHAEMIQRNPDAELFAICDLDKEVLKELQKFEVPLYDHIDSLLRESESFDVLTVATPNGFHAAHALSGLSKHKHVVIEKPMALTSSDCKAIIQKAGEVSKEVFCVMQNRYSPPSVWLKELIDEGILGKIFMVQINCFWNRDHRYYTGRDWRGSKNIDGGTLFTQFSHFIDMMYWLFGDISNIKSVFADFNHRRLTDFEDSASVIFEFISGGIGNLNYSTAVWDKNMESSMIVLAEHGSIKIGGQYMNEVEYCHIKDYTMPELERSSPANDYGLYKGSAANHHLVYKNVIEVLRSKKHITTNSEQGMKVVEMIETIYLQNPFITNTKK